MIGVPKVRVLLLLTGFLGLAAVAAWPQTTAQQRQLRLVRQQGEDAAAAARFELAERRYLKGDLAGARQALDSLLTASPEAPVANDALALLLRCELLGEEPEAVVAFLRAERLERQGGAEAGQAWEAVFGQGRGRVTELALLTRAALLADRRPIEAGRDLERLLREHPETPYAGEARVGLADLLAGQGRLAEAVSICEAGLVAAPDDARAPQLRLRLQAWQPHASPADPAAPAAADSIPEGSREPSAPIPH
ncbi:MAG: tetratricopeptide repeat protein [Candidatus Latescibacterota bacterium]|jgi:predicted Zn-dependent protease